MLGVIQTPIIDIDYANYVEVIKVQRSPVLFYLEGAHFLFISCGI